MPSPTNRPELLGSATLSPQGSFEARSCAAFTLTYTAGAYGIDDTGGIKVAFRFVSDMGKPQTEDPEGVNYVTAEASNGAVLKCWYDAFGHFRPWDSAVFIRVVNGCLAEGDSITVRFGDRRFRSPGMQLQTFCEGAVEFRVLVDAIATGHYEKLAECPQISVVAGDAVNWKAVIPSRARLGDPFALAIKAEDLWGNPTDKAAANLVLESSLAVGGLPDRLVINRGTVVTPVPDLQTLETGVLRISVKDENDRLLCRSNPMQLTEPAPQFAYWGDLHGQSGETVGTGTARGYFEFARDRAFLDVCSHQGNDFEITNAFWKELNVLTAEFNEPGKFVAIPGYEWSGNTRLGGDHNVYFADEGCAIRRSSHALIEDQSDIDMDCRTVRDLFAALKDVDALTYAHAGGRYADLKAGHDGDIETAVEIHSAWGTFEWLLHDAFDIGARVGVVCNSDGHKGRPGASYPGASQFGAYGGLTCFLMNELTRDAVFDCLRHRRHFGTTGARMIVDLAADFGNPEKAVGIGDIVQIPEGAAANIRVKAIGTTPIERVEFLNAKKIVATKRPFSAKETGGRIKVLLEGANYRGRNRAVNWNGRLRFSSANIERYQPVNWWNAESPVTQTGPRELSWEAITTGNSRGFDIWLDGNARDGLLTIETPLVTVEIELASISCEDTILDAGGLGRRVRIFRLPEENAHFEFDCAYTVPIEPGRDNPLYVRIVQEDGHIAWTSPIYAFI
ncbi:MAG: DUF3604 domain-containing protein [Rhodospirillales bacterium]|nr:DUF3604 domain-containing protein [Rhodospirillales bacterium]